MYLEYKGEKRYIYVCEKDYFSKSFSLPLNAQELQYAILNFAQDHKITDLQHIGVEVHCPEAYSSNPDEKLILTYHKDKNKEEIEQSIKKRVEELKKEIDENLDMHIKEYTKCLNILLENVNKDNTSIVKE